MSIEKGAKNYDLQSDLGTRSFVSDVWEKAAETGRCVSECARVN